MTLLERTDVADHGLEVAADTEGGEVSPALKVVEKVPLELVMIVRMTPSFRILSMSQSLPDKLERQTSRMDSADSDLLRASSSSIALLS